MVPKIMSIKLSTNSYNRPFVFLFVEPKSSAHNYDSEVQYQEHYVFGNFEINNK